MKRTSLIPALGSAAIAAFLIAAQPAVAADTLKVSTCLPKSHDQIETFFETFYDPINAAGGPLKLNHIGGPEVTPRKKQAAALKRGLIDLIICPGAYYPGLVSEARLLILSNRSPAEMRANGGMALLQEAWSKKMNAKILGWGYWGGARFNIYTAEKPKEDPKTGIRLDGVKIRSVGLYNPMLKAMGAVPVTISAGEVYTALERGLVKGVAWPEGAVVKFGWQKFLKYKIYPNFFRSTTMIMVNEKKFASLSKGAQAQLVKQGLIFEKTSPAVQLKKVNIDNEKLHASGVAKYELSPANAKAYLDTVYGESWKKAAATKLSRPIEEYRKLMVK